LATVKRMVTRVGTGVLALTLAGVALLVSATSAGAQIRDPLLASAGRAAPPRQLALHGGGLGARMMAALIADYPHALLEPASTANYTVSDRGLGDINRIVIHVAEGGFASTYQWFKNPAAQSSAHYVVASTGQVAQMVPEHDIAWHAGNWDYNLTSIGIEHAGYTNVTHFPDVQYRASAHLAASIARRYLIPPERTRVIGHNQVPDPFHKGEFGGADHHTDPGSTWNWPRYMSYLRLYSDQTWQSTVDDSDSGASHSSAWVRESAGGAVGGSYLRTPSHRGDAISYAFQLPQTDSYDVFARWPCVSGLPNRVTIAVETTQGRAHLAVSQRHCGQWRSLGTWPMAAGTAPRVLVGSRAGGGSAVADSVRLVEMHDLVAPAAVEVSTATSPDSLAFSWPASHDNIGVGAYQLWIDRRRVYEGDALAYTASGLDCGTSHLISLRTVDLAGNRSPAQRFRVATDPCPNPVTGLQVTSAGQTTVTLGWQSGGGSVSGYAVYFAGGAMIGQTATPSFTAGGLTCGTAYEFSVRALDSAGDRSGRTLIPAATAPC
jgi:N-acetyl-anhydromuramyl-L-alanine amidase AmpD